MDIMKALETRYSTKKFDKTKQIPQEDMQKIEELLQMSPSSTNIQPWHFVIASTEEGKKRVAKSAGGFYQFNEAKILDASAVVVFATRTEITEEYFNHLSDKEEQDGRFAEEKHKKDNHGARKIFAHMHKYDYKDLYHWCEKQTYLNLGNFLLGIGALGIDGIAMEGVDMKVLDEEFGLREKGFTSSLVVAIGYHSADDFNKKLPKSRLSKDEIIERV